MSDKTGIEWTDATWNPVTGCTQVSPGCDNCYALTFAERFRGTPGHYFEHGFDVQLRPDKLNLPLRWGKPRRVFVNSMSDLFHDSVPDEYIAKVFSVMAAADGHTFQLLTKRHARMRTLLSSDAFRELVFKVIALQHPGEVMGDYWPLPNVWLGVSAENQQWADIRIPALLDTPAAVRFISAEPLLAPINLYPNPISAGSKFWLGHLDWVIVGGESGRGARPMHSDWARSLRDQCQAVGVPFLFKQWGEWTPIGSDDQCGMRPDVYLDASTGKGTYWQHRHLPGIDHLVRIGKKAAGRELDGRTWDEYPKSAADV